LSEEVGNQTTRRRGGRVGRWVLAVRLENRHPFSRLPQWRDRLFPYIEHPTDILRAVFRYFHRPRGGGHNIELGTTHHQTRWGGWNRRISGKMRQCIMIVYDDLLWNALVVERASKQLDHVHTSHRSTSSVGLAGADGEFPVTRAATELMHDLR